jgi:penicillin-binding protein 1A
MNGGYKATPHIIRRISTADGKVLYENTYDNPPRVLEPNIVSMMNGMMMRVITEGTGKNARIPGWSAAGKSGTTQSFRDALFVGYTSNLTTGVWFGNDDGKSMKKVTGGGLPAKAWSQFMTAAHEGLSPSPLFGTAGGGEPVMDGTEPAPEGDQLFDIISRTLGNEPARDGQAVADEQTGAVPLDDGFTPPADVGQQGQTGTRRTTLLDVLLGG